MAVDGTGPEEVVTEADVRTTLDAVSAPAARTTAGAASGAGDATRTVTEARELGGIQQTVSERLGESYRNAVHVTVKRTFDAGTMVDVAGMAEDRGVDASLTDLLLKGVGETMAAHPAFNALFEGGEHRLIEEVNVGVAVDVDGGLVTPVVPDVRAKSAEEVADVRETLTERTLAGEFTSEDLAGGTFTVTNLGMFGVDSFDPVINPPETAILGAGRVRENGTMTLSLSFDHRVVNGADAARYLDDLVGTLTDPGTLVSFFDADLFA
jgi:pyruvate dehydrogenase E2 component (dihydrolipoamide acetyltransferase)